MVIFEDTNYIHKRTKDGLNLFRLLGAIECLEVEKIERVNVLEVKKLTKQLLAGIKKLENLTYEVGRGKGWMYKNKRVSIHCLEAYLVYWLFADLSNLHIFYRPSKCLISPAKSFLASGVRLLFSNCFFKWWRMFTPNFISGLVISF